MHKHIYPFPYGGARLAGRLDRLVGRWSRGLGDTVEEYSLGLANGRSRHRPTEGSLEVTERRVSIPGLADSFRGFRIVQLTDIHHGLYLPLAAVMEAVALVNRLRPDVVALTGDFVTYSRAFVEPVATVLGMLRARYGVYAVLGNHDFRVGADLIARELRRAKIEVLRNSHTQIRRYGHPLYIAGIDDVRYRADLTRALRGIPIGAPTVLLSHNPAIIRRAARSGVSLVLSGHYHGGQVRVPGLSAILGRFQDQVRFKVGLDRLGGTQIYVSRGIGTVVLPLRFRCPAEIPRLHLQPADLDSELRH
jgi:predicted MPP superfamily phosphohydrolase